MPMRPRSSFELLDALGDAVRPGALAGADVADPILRAAPAFEEGRHQHEAGRIALAREHQHVEFGIAADRAEIARIGDAKVPHQRPAPEHEAIEVARRHVLAHRGPAPVALAQRKSGQFENVSTHAVLPSFWKSHRLAQPCSRSRLQAFEIIGDAAFEIEFGLVAQFLLRARNVVDAVHRVGRAEEVQSRPDFDHRVGQVLAQDGGDVLERDADAGADIEHAAVEVFRHGREIDAERGILVVDEIVLLIAALRDDGTADRSPAAR